MPQQGNIWAAEDDWTGVTDRQRRRRLQNRLNQRTYRMKRKVIASDTSLSREATELSTATPSTPNHVVQRTAYPLSHAADPEDNDLDCHLFPPGAVQFRRQFEAIAHQSFLLGSPQVEHLISLHRLNVHRAINENIRAIGMSPEWTKPDDALSIFNLPLPLPGDYDEERIPPSLRPTVIQRLVPHHPWLDFFPFPRMRDLMILAGDSLDDDDLCHDLMAFWDTRNTGATLVVWGEPWDPRNWEATEEFVRKWRWLLAGSPELLASTNVWRAKRGDRPLNWQP
ncbi:hypothetical protein BO78DRAFT_367731 [Aspergillus sclerotiicarbonarius CBS 121057]|uniref:BZIP domain-containing protein n=1 Tax=Aspergillus sclerotiicarbonarius (strain CBS 121057 / IBT 28362) TaxID=1448318 RepID=A0A319EA40_ASPSB|nr:hypothetical protein BO78DRAFT_367731 [Aspergillus sclerotiicarbonarius CBS 121057]